MGACKLGKGLLRVLPNFWRVNRACKLLRNSELLKSFKTNFWHSNSFNFQACKLLKLFWTSIIRARKYWTFFKPLRTQLHQTNFSISKLVKSSIWNINQLNLHTWKLISKLSKFFFFFLVSVENLQCWAHNLLSVFLNLQAWYITQLHQTKVDYYTDFHKFFMFQNFEGQTRIDKVHQFLNIIAKLFSSLTDQNYHQSFKFCLYLKTISY